MVGPGAVAKVFEDLDKPGSPGATVAIVSQGEVLHTASFGHASLEHSVPNTRETVFYIASVSKQFVACCIALLEADGALSLDDDIRKYVPELGYTAEICVHHLVHHTSGIRDKYALGTIGGLPEESYGTDEGTMRLLSRQRTLNFPPGSRFMYSNSGYFLLAQIIGRVSGKPLREFAEERIFGPLGMKHTIFRDDPGAIIPGKASGYARRAGGGWRLAEYTWSSLGPGGVFTTVDDLAKWDEAMYGGVLEPSDLHTRMRRTRPLTDGKHNSYAFALMVDTYRGMRTVHHGGGVAGYSAELMRFPDQKLSVICLANTSAAGSSLRARKVGELYLADELEPQADKAEPRESVEVDEDLVLGRFLSEDEASLAELIKSEDGFVARVAGQSLPLQPASPNALIVLGETRLVFDADGFEIHAPGDDEHRRFIRLEDAEPRTDIAGRYVSDELGVALEVSSDNDELLVARDGEKPVVLKPLSRDLFAWEVHGLSARFELPLFVVRDEQGRPEALKVNVDRAIGTLFRRDR